MTYLSDKDKFMRSYALSQREYPLGIGVGRTMRIKKHVLSKYHLASDIFLYDAPDNVCDEILTAIREEWLKKERKQ